MAEQKKKRSTRTKKPAKQTQPAQEVQEVIDNKNNPTKDIIFFALQAKYLMEKAAKHYNKPKNEIHLTDALNMLNSEDLSAKDKAILNDNIEDIEQAAETITGKSKEDITIMDLQDVIKEYMPPERFDPLEELKEKAAAGTLTDKEQEELNRLAESAITAAGLDDISTDKILKENEELNAAIIKGAIKDYNLAQPFLSDEILKSFTDAVNAAAGVGEMVKAVNDTINAIANSIDFKVVTESLKESLSFISDLVDNADRISEISGRALEFEKHILPYVMLEIAERTGYKELLTLSVEDISKIIAGEAAETSAGYNEEFEKAFNEACDQFAFDGEPLTPYGHELLEAAAKRKAEILQEGQQINAIISIAEIAAETTTDKKQAEQIKKKLPELKQLPQIIAQQIDSVNYPLDKPNSNLWNLLTEVEPNGQLRIDFDTSKKGSGQEALITYALNFDALENMPELKITRKLTPFDKRVYIIAAALFNAGNEVITATQIYKADHDKEPSDKDIEKINDSLTKMGAAHVFIDNNKEINVNKKYQQFYYDASLLPFERMSAYINGKLAETAIHLLREPPLITFAKERKQITTIDREILLAPISKTDANLRIEDYLIERISHMKSPRSKAPRKLLYSTIYENCGITEKKQKQRAPEKIKRFLDYYIEKGFIKGYSENSTEGITITL